MRTTLDIDNEILAAVKELARQRHVALGKAVSDLVRQALTGSAAAPRQATYSVGGFQPFAANGRVVSNILIDDLRDSAGV
jgi:hypothetical protein